MSNGFRDSGYCHDICKYVKEENDHRICAVVISVVQCIYTSGELSGLNLPNVMGRKPARDTSFITSGRNSNSALAVYYLCIQLDVLIKFFSLFCNLIRTTKNLQWGQLRYICDTRPFHTCTLSSGYTRLSFPGL